MKKYLLIIISSFIALNSLSQSIYPISFTSSGSFSNGSNVITISQSFGQTFSNNLISNGLLLSEGVQQTFGDLPSIISFSPSVGTTGTTITIKGSTFTNATAVSFGGTAATSFSVINDSTITAIVAAGASGSIAVTNSNGLGSIAGFTYQTPFQTDSLALVDLYNSTNGANWTNHTNWLTAAPVSSWYGVGVNNGRITNLNLPNNNLFGSIPNSIGNLSELVYLDMQQSMLTGNIPTSITNLPKLTVLGLAANQLSGSLPSSIGNLVNLKWMYLHSNKLSGTIPSSIGNLTNLTTLWLATNQLNGAIPTSIGNLTNLIDLNLGSNQLTGVIPSSFASLTKLIYLSSGLNQLSGSIPDFVCTFASLKTLDLNNNSFTGNIPNSIGNLINLSYLDLNHNQLNGVIPSSIGNLLNLNHFDLHHNNLNGNLPNSIVNLNQLTLLNLRENQLSGSIPNSIGNLLSLIYLHLDSNQLTGTIPNSVVNLINLNSLTIDNNQLTGTIPIAIDNLTKLMVLDLGQNQLNGNIPTSIVNLVNLTYLDLHYNQLSGSIPTTIGNLSNLTVLGLAGNQLTGTIPNSISSLVKLTGLYLHLNQLSGTIPSNIGNLTNLVTFFLSSNKLTGTIPSSIGNLTKLNGLYFDNNLFSGSIPSSFGVLANLSILHLENNNLISPIPNSISGLSFSDSIFLQNNYLTFTGLEIIAQLPHYKSYSPQATIHLTQTSNKLIYSVGGTPTNNTFKWYKDNITNLVATKSSDSTFTPTVSGKYFAIATNAVATALTLYSDTITVLIPSITSFSPSVGTTGTVITIKGSTFTNASAVSFGGTAASSFTVVNDSVINAVVGSGASGSVAVTNSAGVGSLAGFKYCVPTASSTNISVCNSVLPYTWNGSSYSSAGTYTKTIVNAAGCDSVATLNLTVNNCSQTCIWTGASNNLWNIVSNWSNNVLPTNTSNVTIPAFPTNQPVLNSDITINGLNNSGSLSLNGKTLTITGAMSGKGVIIGSATSNLVINSAANDTVYFGTGATDSLLASFTQLGTGTTVIGSGVGIIKELDVYGGTLNTNNHLTLKSSSAATAYLTPLMGILVGKATVEHYIPKGLKTYRLLSVGGVYNTGSIFNNWQEGGRNTAGYGAYITGNYSTTKGYNATTGLDNSYNGYRNMFSNPTQNTAVDIINSKTTSFDPYTAYTLFLHGDRTGNLISSKFFNADSMNSGTVLRATGNLIYGTVTYSTKGVTNANYSSTSTKLASTANAETSVTNPYAGILDWESVGLTGITNTYYYADPSVLTSGLPTTVSYNSTSHTNSNPSKFTLNRYIQPGQAFFVVNDATNSSRQLVMNQSSYIGGRLASTGGVFKPTKPLNRIAISLWKNEDNIDGAVAIFDNRFKKEYGNEDSRKLHSSNGNIWINEAGNELSIDGLPEPTGTEAIAINLGNLEAGNQYKLVVNTAEFTSNNGTAYLVDNLLHTTTALESGATIISIQQIAESTSRYSIVFKKAGLPIAESTTKGITVYPNPVKGNSFNISLSEVAKGSYSLSIYNSLGKVVMSKTIQTDGNAITQTIEIDAPLTNGIYTVQLKGANGNYETKVMVQ